jgi:iron-sulfur cluster insertion protein
MINLTSSAKNYLTDTTKKHNKKYAYLGVLGGGCSGFQYKFDLDESTNDDDHVFETDGTKLVIDDVSLGLLGGAVVDFKTDLGGSFFQVENPNASANCGCGASFSL